MDVRPEISDAKPRRRGLRSLIWLGLFAFLLFIPAGTARWPGAWVYLAILAVATVSSATTRHCSPSACGHRSSAVSRSLTSS